jgi:hypothetical protein
MRAAARKLAAPWFAIAGSLVPQFNQIFILPGFADAYRGSFE